MIVKAAAYLVSLISLPLFSIFIQGQKDLSETRKIEQNFSQVWKISEATRKSYSWKARTEVIRDNKTLQVLVEEVSYAPDGRQVRKVLSNREAPLPSVFLIRQLAEGQKEKIIAFMGDLRLFLEKYALDDDSARHAFFSSAAISASGGNGLLLVSGSDVFAGGDRLKWWIDTRSYSIVYAAVSTTFRNAAVEFSASYYILPNLNYMSRAKISVPSEEMVIDLQFYDFVKR
jgi:hypothetical protein